MKRILMVLGIAAAFAATSFAQIVHEPESFAVAVGTPGETGAGEVFEVMVDAPDLDALAPEASVFYFQSAPEPPEPPAAPAPPAVYVKTGGSYLGVGVQEIGKERGKELKLSDVHGVEVTRVEPESPAGKAGLQVGDVVLEYNGQRVEGVQQFQRMVKETPADRQVQLSISRGGATQTITATVGVRKKKAFVMRGELGGMAEPHWQMEMERLQGELGSMRMRMPGVPGVHMMWRSGALGIEAESIGPQLASFFGVKDGVLVRSVTKDTPADKAGIQAGDVITKVDGQEVTTPSGISERIGGLGEKKTFPVTLTRERKEQTVNVTIEAKDSDGGRPRRVMKPQTEKRVVTVHSSEL
jgi:serine protease Do